MLISITAATPAVAFSFPFFLSSSSWLTFTAFEVFRIIITMKMISVCSFVAKNTPNLFGFWIESNWALGAILCPFICLTSENSLSSLESSASSPTTSGVLPLQVAVAASKPPEPQIDLDLRLFDLGALRPDRCCNSLIIACPAPLWLLGGFHSAFDRFHI